MVGSQCAECEKQQQLPASRKKLKINDICQLYSAYYFHERSALNTIEKEIFDHGNTKEEEE